MFTTLEVSVDQRGNKLFIDFSQNDEADNLAVAYSGMPAKQPSVSTHIEWDELSLKMKPSDFTIENILVRLLDKVRPHNKSSYQSKHFGLCVRILLRKATVFSNRFGEKREYEY